MKIIITAAVVIVVLLGVVLLVAAAGMVEVAADVPHGGVTAWYLELARERAIAGELDAVEVPELGDGRAAAGAVAYAEMCAGCHGAPGAPPSVIGRGLSPEPPDLADEDWSAAGEQAEAFWVITHGIRMTGMPAFGVTHDDDAVWDLVAFLARLPELDQTGYEEYTATGEVGDGHAGHEHDRSEETGQPADVVDGSESGGDDHQDHQHD